jgi:hypothetical protein
MMSGMSGQLFHRGLSQSQAAHQAYLRIYDALITHATVQSYMDVAWLLAVPCLAMIPLVLVLKKNNLHAAPVHPE